MKGWEKIESRLNKAIENFGEKTKAGYKSLKDKKWDPSTRPLRETLGNSVRTIGGKVILVKDKVKSKADKASKSANAVMKKAQNINVKELSAKSMVAAFIAFLAPLGLKFKAWYLGLKPETLLIYTVSATVAGLSSIQIYKSTQKIQEEKSIAANADQVEELESGDAISKRPGYHNLRRKHLPISNVTIPVYIETANTVRSLVIDFEVETSNRYLREYFYENEHLVKDRLSNTIQPIIPEFPLTIEGKVILKDKIKREMDALIKELKIEGNVKQVMFQNVIAG